MSSIGSIIASKVQEPLNLGSAIASKMQELTSKVEEPLNYMASKVQEPLSHLASKVEEPLNYMASKVQDPLLENLDRILQKKGTAEKQCEAHWKTLAPNMEDYSGLAPKLITAGSGILIKGILWCGDVTIDGLMWGNDFMKQRLTKAEKQREVSSATMKNLERVKNMTKMMEKRANDILSSIIKFLILFLSLVVNSKVGKILFSLPSGEMVLATADGFNKVFDAAEIAGTNVLKTSSTVTTELVDHKYGAKTAHATNEGFEAAGHALGAAWTVFKIIPALNPKSAMTPS